MNRIQWRRKQQAKRQADKNRRRRRLHKKLYEASKTVRYSAMYSTPPTFQMACGSGDLVAENLRAAFKALTRGNPHVELAVKMFNIKDRRHFEIDVLTKKKRKEFYAKPNKLREKLRALAHGGQTYTLTTSNTADWKPDQLRLALVCFDE